MDVDLRSDAMRPVRRLSSVRDRWDAFWFADIPAHVYAALRIAFGLLGAAAILGLLDIPLFWSCSGLVASRNSAVCQSFGPLTVGRAYPLAVALLSILSFLAMAVGFYSRAATVAAYISIFLIARWNELPLSAAHQVLRSILFCLMFADSGRVWSVDALLGLRRVDGDRSHQWPDSCPVWPLRLMQIQIALIYFATGLWKLNNVTWRDGSALHYVFANPQFRRFSFLASPALDPWTTVATYATLAWELAFAALVLNRRLRYWALGFGVALHVALWAVMELGPFSGVMIASYLAFADPVWVRDRLTSWMTLVRPGRRSPQAPLVPTLLERTPKVGVAEL